MTEIEVRTQAELDAAIERQQEDDEVLIVVCGNGWFVINSGAPRMVARGSSAPTMVARGSSAPRMVAWESSAPTMVARESSAVTGKAGRYSQPRFWRHDNSQIDIPGAVILEAPEIKTAEEWLEYYGVEVDEGVATLFKAVDNSYVSSRSFTYEPGSEPKCDDWNPNPKISCGEGLHFCPAPSIALGYMEAAAKFVACPVAVADIVLSAAIGVPDKVRAPKVAGPVWECDINGEKVEAAK